VSAHPLEWVTARPLWPALLAGLEGTDRQGPMRRPALLRFERDSFMQDLAEQLGRDPSGLSGYLATPATYRLPVTGEVAPPTPSDLKLYAAVHGHFNLVAATLVCQLPGLPQHEVDAAAGERVAFVMRRLDDAAGGEWAWTIDPSRANVKAWTFMASAATRAVAADEQLLPLFPLLYRDGERQRRLFVGLVPTTARDAFAATVRSPSPPPTGGSGGAPADPRLAALTAKVTGPLRALAKTPPQAADGTPAAEAQLIKDAASKQQIEASRFVLLDFAELLTSAFGWFATDPPTPPGGGARRALWTALGTTRLAGPPTLLDALTVAWRERLAIGGVDPSGTQSTLTVDLGAAGLDPDAIDAAVAAALAEVAPVAPATGAAVSIQGEIADPPAVPKLDARSASRYVLRCVYQRPQCGPLHKDVVSDASEPFRIAGFFDLDAPARPITIAMPVDTDIRDLRKLRKSVNFALSNQLRAQMNRVTSLSDALKGQFAAGEEVDLGLVCSFSIPIITICALIVLMIAISLLNIVFWWMPFLRICFPLQLKAGQR
jgi:hypothetical protein